MSDSKENDEFIIELNAKKRESEKRMREAEKRMRDIEKELQDIEEAKIIYKSHTGF